MRLSELKFLYALLFGILGLIALVPLIQTSVYFPGSETFSEIILFSPNRVISSYPVNITADQEYNVSINIINHMNDIEYYKILVKLRNQTDPVPVETPVTPSNLPALHEYDFVLEDEAIWERIVSFSFNYVYTSNTSCLVSSVMVDRYTFVVDKPTLKANNNDGFNYQLFFELWRFDRSVSTFSFTSSYVGIQLKMTSSS